MRWPAAHAPLAHSDHHHHHHHAHTPYGTRTPSAATVRVTRPETDSLVGPAGRASRLFANLLPRLVADVALPLCRGSSSVYLVHRSEHSPLSFAGLIDRIPQKQSPRDNRTHVIPDRARAQFSCYARHWFGLVPGLVLRCWSSSPRGERSHHPRRGPRCALPPNVGSGADRSAAARRVH